LAVGRLEGGRHAERAPGAVDDNAQSILRADLDRRQQIVDKEIERVLVR
jgi:hypothetical protein